MTMRWSSTGPRLFADPDKVHELNYDGEWFKVRGPLTVPRTPQGRPVLLQAGSSGSGARLRRPMGRGRLHR